MRHASFFQDQFRAACLLCGQHSLGRRRRGEERREIEECRASWDLVMGSTTTLADTWNTAKLKGVFKTMIKTKSELSPKLNLFFIGIF
jgi:hypothetical protein